MKDLNLFLIAFFIGAGSSNCFGTIHTVSASDGFPSQFKTISAAYQAASNGDTIIIHPGYYTGELIFAKRLVLIGAGLNPKNNNTSPTIWYGLIYLSNGAGGSVFMGIHFQRTIINDNDFITNNLIFSECRFSDGPVRLRGSNILVQNCIFERGLHLYLDNASNNIVRNSVFNSFGNLISDLQISFGTNTSVLNNVFTGNNANVLAINRAVHWMPLGSGVLVANNIFYNVIAFDANINGDCNYQNNVYFLSTNQMPAGNSNIMANPAFEQYPAGGDKFDYKYSFKLAANSPAKGHGIGGADAGIWGGETTVNEGWEPPIPRINGLKVKNPIVPQGGTLQISISGTKAN